MPEAIESVRTYWLRRNREIREAWIRDYEQSPWASSYPEGVSMPETSANNTGAIDIGDIAEHVMCISADKEAHRYLIKLLVLIMQHGKISSTDWNGDRNKRHIQINKEYIGHLKSSLSAFKLYLKRHGDIYYLSLQKMNPQSGSDEPPQPLPARPVVPEAIQGANVSGAPVSWVPDGCFRA